MICRRLWICCLQIEMLDQYTTSLSTPQNEAETACKLLATIKTEHDFCRPLVHRDLVDDATFRVPGFNLSRRARHWRRQGGHRPPNGRTKKN